MQVDQLKWLWAGVVVGIFALHGLLWEGMGLALREQGFGSESFEVVTFIAFTTLPLAIGAAILTFYFTGLIRKGGESGYGPWIITAAVVWGSAFLGSTVYGGVLNPTLTTPTGGGTPPVLIARAIFGGIAAYLYSYGLALFASGVLVGWAAAYSIQVVGDHAEA